MRIISNDDVRQLVGMREALDAYDTVLREYYDGYAVARPRIDVWSPTSNPEQFYQWGSMEGLSRHFGVFVIRMKSDVAYFDTKPDGTRTQEKFNTRPGLFCGLLWAFSIETGTPLAIIQDGYLQHLRAGAKAGLAAQVAALPEANVVGMLGSGGMARSHLRAFAAVRPIQTCRVYSPTRANRERYAEEMAEELGIAVQAVETPEDAVSGAHMIACCTSAIEPVLRGAWIPDGAFISVVKGSSELDEAALQRVSFLLNFDREEQHERSLGTDGWSSYLSGSHISYVAGHEDDYAAVPRALRQPRTRNPPRVLYRDVVEGRHLGRTSARDVVLFGGGDGIQGLQFAAVVGLACQRAAELDVGHVLPDDWFLQTERN